MIDQEKVRLMTAYLEVALTGFQDYFEIQVEIGRITYSENNAKIALKVSEIGDDGTAITKEAEAFRLYADSYDMRPEWLGRQFTTMGDTFTIAGLNTRAKKHPVQAVNSRGQRYKFSPITVKLYMEKV